MLFQSLSIIAIFVSLAVASPVKRQSISTLSTAQIAAFKPYSLYAAVGYCEPANTLGWNCGANCQANPTFKPIASGGNGGSVQFWYVGYDPTLKTVIVSHQGTSLQEVEAIITDARFIPNTLDSKLFPGVPSDVKVHSGFRDAHKDTATEVLAAVKSVMSANSVNDIAVVGHSLGAAIATLDSVYLKLQIPKANVKLVGYGSPRVGNPEFADWVDTLGISLTHISNKRDIVPILPGRFLDYAHTSGEIHINEDNTWASCPGHDNTDKRCTIGAVPNILIGDVGDHLGPYDGISMRCA